MSAESFSAMLRRLRIEAGLSQNQLARRSGVDPAYVNRLERAGKQQRNGDLIHESVPRRMVVLSLAQVLDLSPGRTDRLLFAAGLAPTQDWQTRAQNAEAVVTTIREALAVSDEPTLIRSRVG